MYFLTYEECCQEAEVIYANTYRQVYKEEFNSSLQELLQEGCDPYHAIDLARDNAEQIAIDAAQDEVSYFWDYVS